MPASLIRRLTLCKLSLCETFKVASDKNGLWGECQKCGKRVGHIGRLELRAIARREEQRARG